MSRSLIQIRVEDNLKMKASQIYSDLGLDISTAVRMLVKYSRPKEVGASCFIDNCIALPQSCCLTLENVTCILAIL